MKKYFLWGLLLTLLPATWAQGGQVRPEKAQRQQARRVQMPKQAPPPAPSQAQTQGQGQGETPAQRRADLRAALLAKRPPGEPDDNKHLTPTERMELRQQLRQQQLQRAQGKG
jgi:hypothetical protein